MGLPAGWSVPAVTPTYVLCGRPGGEGRSVCHPPSGAWLGGGGERGEGGRSASVRPSASLGCAPKRAYRRCLVHGGCGLHAAQVCVRPCPCAPPQECRPVEVTLGVVGRRFWGARRKGLVGLLPGCRGPRGQGAPLARRWGYRADVTLARLRHSVGRCGEERWERRTPRRPPSVPRCL